MCAAGLCLTPPGPSRGPGRCRQGGAPPRLGPVSLRSRLFCSLSALPAPPAGHRWAGAWVSLVPPCSHPWPWGISGRSWGLHPAARSRPVCLSRGKLGRPLPAAGAGDAPPGPRLPQSPPGRGEHGGGLGPHCTPSWGETSSVSPETRLWGEGRTPKGHRPQEGRPWGRRPCPTPLATQAGPGPGDILLWFPLASPFPADASLSDLGLSAS